MKKYLNEQFLKIFNETDGICYFSPGRVNLIGEHIDYNGGHVFPAAISIGTYGIVKLRNDKTVKIYSDGFSEEPYEFNLDNFEKNTEIKWTNYIKGVFFVLKDEGYDIPNGFDLFITSNLPNGSGLSSSASLESLVIVILNDLYNLELSIPKRALLGQRVENDYLGLNTGIMDQFSIIAGKKDHAILLNTDTLDYEYVPFNLRDYQLLIINTNKQRGLTDSKYNERFFETKKALNILKESFNIKTLAELKVSDLPKVRELLNDDLLYKRTRHVITEETRTVLSKKYLEENKIIEFAASLNESHYSLRDDYEVTGTELDTLQNLLIKYNALGARMTGAGFGGCAIAVIRKEDLNNIKLNVIHDYEKRIGYQPSFYDVSLNDGTKKM